MRLFIGIELSEEIKGAFVNYQNILKRMVPKKLFPKRKSAFNAIFHREVSVDELFMGKDFNRYRKAKYSLCFGI